MIRIWMADVSALLQEETYEKYYERVPLFRKEKADQLRFQNDKALSVGAWTLLMMMREEYQLSEENVFNLSHSGTHVLCAVDDTGSGSIMVGCDLEEIKEERLKIAERFFCESEYKYILEHPGSFYRYWVLKESFMKATRYGMKLGLNDFEIKYENPNEPVLVMKPEYIDGDYYFKEYDVTPLSYKVAVCASEKNFDDEIKIIKL